MVLPREIRTYHHHLYPVRQIRVVLGSSDERAGTYEQREGLFELGHLLFAKGIGLRQCLVTLIKLIWNPQMVGVCGASNVGQSIFGWTDHCEIIGGGKGLRLSLQTCLARVGT